MIRENEVQSQVVSYQKRYLIPPCLTLSNIRYVSRVKWNNPGKRVAPSPKPWCRSYWKGSLLVTIDSAHQLKKYLNITCLITTVFIAILIHYTLSPIMLKNQNFIFFVMQWWWYFVPLLKSSLQTHTHSHTHMNR